MMASTKPSCMVANMRKYTTPVVRSLGRMDSVTRKSGGFTDTGTHPTAKNDNPNI
jgi:hypothetical protein